MNEILDKLSAIANDIKDPRLDSALEDLEKLVKDCDCFMK